jgi:hypothetical protein
MKKKVTTNLHLYVPTMDGSKEKNLIVDHHGEGLYYSKPFFDEDLKSFVQYDPEYYSNFTFVLNRDGTLWYEANLFLLDLIEKDSAYYESQRVSRSTISEHANSLQKYKLFCDERDDENDLTDDEREVKPYWRVAKRPFSRPNIKYRNQLQDQVSSGEINKRYASKLLYPITAFYNFINEKYGKDYLILGKGVVMPGNITKVIIETGDEKGILVDSNEANNIRGSNNDRLGYIKDGGNQKPLTPEQQIKVFEVINEKGQPEIIISHLFSVYTGARMDTTFTLRLRTFMNCLPDDYTLNGLREWRNKNDPFEVNKEYKILVGARTLIDAKGLDKEYKLYVRGWIMEMVRTYAVSKRAAERRKNIKFPQKDPLDEYVFITNEYNPYYVAKSDPNKGYYNNLPNGGAIRTYHTNNIRKKIDFEFKFHFLRATYLMNLVQMLRNLPDELKMSESTILKEAQLRAGHTSPKTTQGYLEHKEQEEKRLESIDMHGDKLLEWINNKGIVKLSEDGQQCKAFEGSE